MAEAEDLDQLTALQEQKNPDWDHASRIATVREGLLENLLSVSEARKAFGDAIVGEALLEMARQLLSPQPA